MQLRVLNKTKPVIIMGIFIIICIITTYELTHRYYSSTKLCYEKGVDLGYSVVFDSNEVNKTGKAMLKPIVLMEMEYSELEHKINSTLNNIFVMWMPEKFKYPELTRLAVELSTNGYLSIYMSYTFYGRIKESMNICNTVNMRTGEAVYLNDLVEVDEEFAKMILTEGILMSEYNWMTDEEDSPLKQESLDEKDFEKTYSELKICSEPFNEDNWLFKPTFYLKENRLYLVNLFNYDSEYYIELEKIKHKLKVDMW